MRIRRLDPGWRGSYADWVMGDSGNGGQGEVDRGGLAVRGDLGGRRCGGWRVAAEMLEAGRGSFRTDLDGISSCVLPEPARESRSKIFWRSEGPPFRAPRTFAQSHR